MIVLRQEPTQSSDGIYRCSPCIVGFYKPEDGADSCILCPPGAECNDLGIVIPCVEKGYWREEPPYGQEADFSKYVFRAYGHLYANMYSYLHLHCVKYVTRDIIYVT